MRSSQLYNLIMHFEEVLLQRFTLVQIGFPLFSVKVSRVVLCEKGSLPVFNPFIIYARTKYSDASCKVELRILSSEKGGKQRAN